MSVYNHWTIPLQYVNRIENSFVHFFITESDVERALSKIKTKKGAVDKVPSYILENCVDVISRVLVYLFNLSKISDVFPNSYKTAGVTPVFKSGVRKDRKIISLFLVVRFLGKFLRELCTKEYSKSLLNSIFFPHQYGFTKKRSTTNANLDFCNQCYNTFESKLYSFISQRKSTPLIRSFFCKK